MRNNTDDSLYYIAVLKAQALQPVFTMQLSLILYILVAVLMVLLILTFVCFAVVFRCKKSKQRQCSEWVTSASIEHLRFDPAEVEAQRIRTSTPDYANTSSVEEFLQMHNNNNTGFFYPQDVNYEEPVLTPAEMQIIENKPKQLLKTFPHTFSSTNEPKYIYWETRV